MKVFKKLARSMRGLNGEGSLQAFYGAIATRNPNGSPTYNESKRDFDAVHLNVNRYMMF
jgi:hypothetical protein